MIQTADTIAAIATPPGRGGVGIIRVSGPQTPAIAEQLLKFIPKPRYAHYGAFYDSNDAILDEGIAIYFPSPHSFTGEDILELQGHGGPVILDIILKHIVSLGARIANPGEFSERAFLNDKLDLSQAEAIADLIDSASEQAARCAVRTLQGDFSKQINKLLEQLTELRIHIEAAIDFPEEEIDFLSDSRITDKVAKVVSQFQQIKVSATQGSLLREGMRIVIAGKPNAGKSSLLNALTGRDTAIVTAIPGTTRDILRDTIHLDGLPLHIIDTAGLRETDDEVEREGVARAKKELQHADCIILVHDIHENQETQNEVLALQQQYPEYFSQKIPLIIVQNKMDLLPSLDVNKLGNNDDSSSHTHQILLSAKTGDGINELKQTIKQLVGYTQPTEGGFIARRRHLDAINRADEYTQQARQRLSEGTGELAAEDLRLAQQALAEITGEFSSDDLLGRIFSSFCIGK